MRKLKREKLRRPIIPEKKKEEKKTALKNIFSKTTKIQAKAFPQKQPKDTRLEPEILKEQEEEPSTEKQEEIETTTAKI